MPRMTEREKFRRLFTMQVAIIMSQMATKADGGEIDLAPFADLFYDSMLTANLKGNGRCTEAFFQTLNLELMKDLNAQALAQKANRSEADVGQSGAGDADGGRGDGRGSHPIHIVKG